MKMNKIITMILVIVCALCFMTACGDKKDDIAKKSTGSNATPQATEPSIDDEADEDEDLGEAGGGIEIYTIDSDSLEITPINVDNKDKKVTAKFIVDSVVNNLDEEVSVYKVSQKGKRVTIAFNPGKAPMEGCSSQVEQLILDCVSSSVLDNLMDCEEVVFTGKEKAYESGHLSFDLDEVYATK